MSEQIPVVRSLKQAFSELQTARDMVRVRANLLGLDARERWRELESGVEALDQKLEREGEKAGALVFGKVAELTQTLKEFIQQKVPLGSKLDAPVSTIMETSVRTCSPDDSLNVPAQIMWEANCGVVPVLGADGRPLGVVTDRDLCMATYTQGQPLAACRVQSAMSQNLYSCRPEDPLERVLQIMKDEQVRRIVVTDDDGKLAGIVALADIARQIRSADDVATCVVLARAVAAVSEPGPKADTEINQAAE